MRYLPPARIDDFARSPLADQLAQAWHDDVKKEINKYRSLDRFLDPLEADDTAAREVIPWTGFPRIFDAWLSVDENPDPVERARRMDRAHRSAEILDRFAYVKLQNDGRFYRVPANPAVGWMLYPEIGGVPSFQDGFSLAERPQDEYLEWFVVRDPVTNRITRIDFTAEPPEYWETLAENDPNLAKDLYSEFLGVNVPKEDLFFRGDVLCPEIVRVNDRFQIVGYTRLFPDDPDFKAGQYNRLNKWNTELGVVHLTQRNNTLFAEINLAARATQQFAIRPDVGSPLTASTLAGASLPPTTRGPICTQNRGSCSFGPAPSSSATRDKPPARQRLGDRCRYLCRHLSRGCVTAPTSSSVGSYRTSGPSVRRSARWSSTSPSKASRSLRDGSLPTSWDAGPMAPRSLLHRRTPIRTSAKIRSVSTNFRFFSSLSPTPLAGLGHPPQTLPAVPADPLGLACPRASHIRKVNPRDGISEIGQEHHPGKLMLRRGIAFGPEEEETPDADRGLLFLSYQTSIVEQFIFVQVNWANATQRPTGDGRDPIIGQDGTPDTARRVQIFALSGRQLRCPFNGRWVIATGGGYFVTPGITGLRHLLDINDGRPS